MITIPGIIKIADSDLQWSFSRSSGPGGQNVNKVNSKATLRWTPPIEFLQTAAGERFQLRASRFLTLDGEFVVQSQQSRDRHQNMQACRQKLWRLLTASATAPTPRLKTKPSAASRMRRLNDKRLNASKKQSRKTLD
jgi:ribosome-associated protein